MRRSVLNALATVSLAALVSVATSSQAAAPASLGTLKQIDKWKVGIVDPEGQSFCAMVNKFDHNVGLAFALSPEGYGSVAVDVATASFTPGEVYQVTLSANGAAAGTFPGRATSPRSVVVQVGQETKFYDALKSNAALGVGMPQFDAQFTLGKFAASYRQLVDCSQTLTGVRGTDGRMPAVKVKEVEKAALAPLDRELAAISGDTQQPPADAAALEAPKDSAKDKSAAFDEADATLEKAGEQAKTSLAALDQKQQSATAEIGDQKQKTAEAVEPTAPAPKRVLLASAKAPSGNVPVAGDTGATAKLWDETQQTAAKEQEALPVSEQDNQARIALLHSVKQSAVVSHVADSAPQVKPVVVETAKVETPKVVETAKVDADADKALRASLAAKQAEIARIDAERAQQAKQAQELNGKLAATQTTFKTQLSFVEAERDTLKKQLADAKSETEFSKARAALLQSQMVASAEQSKKSSAEKSKLDALQAQLQQSEQQRQALEGQLADTSKQTKVLGASLSEKQKQLESTSATAKEIAAAKADADNQKAQNVAAVEGLQRQLANQRSEFANLQTEYDTLKKQNHAAVATADTGLAKKHEELTAQLSHKEAYVSELEQKLAAVEAERTAAAASAQKAQADLEAARKDSTSARKSLVIINDDELPVTLTKKPTAAEAEAAAKKEAELTATRSRVSELETQLDTTREQVAELQKAPPVTAVKPVEQEQALNDQRAKLEAAQSEINHLKESNAALSTKLLVQADPDMPHAAGAAVQPSKDQELALAEQRKKLDTAQAEIDKLKAGNAELSTKLAQAQTAPAPVVAAVKTTPDTAVVAELANTRSRVSELEQQLAAAHEQQLAQKELPAPIGKPRFVPATPVTVASEDLSPVVSAPLPSRKPGTQVHVAKAQVQPDIDVTNEIQNVEPAAGGDDVPAPILSSKWIEPAGSIHHTATPAIPGAQPVQFHPVAAVTHVVPVTHEAVAAPVVQQDPSFNANRAEAFLDRIMAYHRPDGAKKPAPVDDGTPVFEATPHHVAAVVMPSVPVAPVAHAPVTGLSAIETAAGPAPQHKAPQGYVANAQPHAVGAPVVPAEVAQDDLAPIVTAPTHVANEMSHVANEMSHVANEMSHVASETAPVAVTHVPAATSFGNGGIESILASAGISDATFAPAEHGDDGASVRQWTTGGISGMYEQQPAQGSLASNASTYIERYRQDCPALKVNMGANTGSSETANISCPTAGNTYATSFVFWQDAQHFNAVLHSGYPADAAKVEGLAGSIASTLGASVPHDGGSLSPQLEVKHADASVEQYADRPQRHFAIPQTPSASYNTGSSFGQRPAFAPPASAPAGQPDTVVIE